MPHVRKLFKCPVMRLLLDFYELLERVVNNITTVFPHASFEHRRKEHFVGLQTSVPYLLEEVDYFVHF